MSRNTNRPELIIIAVAVAAAVLCVVMIGRRWADRERERRPNDTDAAVEGFPQPPPRSGPEPRLRATVAMPNTSISALALTPGGSLLLVAGSSSDGRSRDQPVVRVWDVEKRIETAVLRREDEVGRYLAITVSPDGKSAAAVGFAVTDGKSVGTICVWDLEMGKPRWSVVQAVQQMECVAWSPDGTRFAAGDVGGNTTVWNAAGGPALATWPTNAGNEQIVVTGLAWSPTGSRLAIAESSGRLRVFKIDDRREVASITAPEQFYSLVTFSAWEETLFVAGRRAGDVWVWHLPTNGESHRLTSHPTPVGGLAVGADFNSLVTVTNDGHLSPDPRLTARGWNVASGMEEWAVSVPTDDMIVCPFAVTRDAKRIALAHVENIETGFRWTVNLYDVPSTSK